MPLPPLRFDNAFLRELPGDPDAGPGIRQVHGALWSRVDPEPVALPRLLAHSREIAEQLGFDAQTVASPEFAAVFAGNALMPGMAPFAANYGGRSEEHTSELQSLMRISYAVFCLKTQTQRKHKHY